MSNCATCGKPISGRAVYCRKHQRNGPKAKPLEDRFWSSVIRAGAEDCWIWNKSKDRKGYGKFGYGSMKDGTRRIEVASRMAWTLSNGPIPKGMFVCHKCDNPPCCNPSHLYLGTCADNLKEMHTKGRFRAKTWLDDEKVREIRSLLPLKSNGEIAAAFGVSYNVIKRIRDGVSYNHVT